MIQIKAEIQTGDYHAAVHTLGDMVAGIELTNISLLGIHIAMSRNSALDGDSETAVLYLDHTFDGFCCDNSLFAEQLTKIQGQLKAGNIDDAVLGLEELLGN
ncbi:MAG: hypothetical protein H8E48_14160 [Chloroflexi bacterium]|nr:hypothetical protein [Chloroflexota bacterium]